MRVERLGASADGSAENILIEHVSSCGTRTVNSCHDMWVLRGKNTRAPRKRLYADFGLLVQLLEHAANTVLVLFLGQCFRKCTKRLITMSKSGNSRRLTLPAM